MSYLFRLLMNICIIMFFAISLGCCVNLKDQNVLANSKIKEKSFKKVFREIKKTLPRELRKCQIEVVDIKLLKND